MTDFALRVLAWFDNHGRKDLPWQQRPNDAYGIWVSEIMLQQTQVQTVIPYYKRFLQSFPTVEALAVATTDQVLSHWSGLGYYARARNLHKAARIICEQYAGEFPTSIDTVLALPGIGQSTAGAILSLAFDQRHAILDGNVKRVLARHAAVSGWPGKTKVRDTLWRLAEQRTPESRVGDYTQAIMDLGATLCSRSQPGCDQCPVRDDCVALCSDTVSNYPGVKQKRAKPLKQTTMVLAVAENSVYLERRPASGIWGGLWSFPELANDGIDEWCAHTNRAPIRARQKLAPLRHSFSHYDLDIQPVLVRLEMIQSTVADNDDAVWYCLDAPPPGGIAAPVQKLIESLRTLDNVANS